MRVAAINDLSGFGKCSLIADISILSSMGIEVCPVPTAVLTAQTGFPSYYMHETEDMIGQSRKEWTQMGVHFDGILTGYMPDENVVSSVLDFTKSFAAKDTVLLVDPVMGDGGKPYPNYSKGMLEGIKELVSKADIITPNLTELYLLAGEAPEKACETNVADNIEKISGLARSVMTGENQNVVVTGISSGQNELINLVVSSKEEHVIGCRYNGRSYSGTGDLFAALLIGNILNGKRIEDAAFRSADFISRAIAATTEKDRNFGVNFEEVLKRRWEE